VHFHHPTPAKEKGRLISQGKGGRERLFETNLNNLQSDQSNILR